MGEGGPVAVSLACSLFLQFLLTNCFQITYLGCFLKLAKGFSCVLSTVYIIIISVETKRRRIGGMNSLSFSLSHHTYMLGHTLGKMIYST